MSQDQHVYDLGEVDERLKFASEPVPFRAPKNGSSAARSSTPASSPSSIPTPRMTMKSSPVGPRPLLAAPQPLPVPRSVGMVPAPASSDRAASRRVGPALTGSCSLLLPGSGQLLAGRVSAGLLVLTSLGLVGTLVWATLASSDRLLGTLELLGLPPQALAWTLLALAGLGAVVHVAGALHAQTLGARAVSVRMVHPVLSGLASAALPGWGQLLNGHRFRAALCLGGVWLVAAAWLGLPRLLPVLDGSVAMLLRSSAWLTVLVATSVVLWCLAVYDAVTGAVAETRG